MSPDAHSVCFASGLAARPTARRRMVLSATLLSIALSWAARPAAAQGDPLAQYNTLVAFYKQQRWDLAARTAARFLESHPDHSKAPLATLYRGQALAQSRKHAEARGVFEGFLERYPDDKNVALARYRIGEANHFLGNDAKAAEDLAAFLEQTASDAAASDLTYYAKLYLGESYRKIGRPADAIEPLRSLIESSQAPQRLRPQAKIELGRALTALSRFDEATRELQSVVASTGGTRQNEARLALGEALFEAGRYDRAQQEFDTLAEAVAGTPAAGNALLNAGNAAYRSGRFDDAFVRFDRAAQTPSVRTTADYWAGLTLKATDRYAAAATRLLDAHNAAPDSPLADELLFQSAESASLAGDVKPALGRFAKLAEEYPESPLADDAINKATTIAIQTGNLDDAATLNRIFEKRFADSPLAPSQTLLAARLELAEIDADDASPTPERTAAITERLSDLLAEPPLVSSVARVLLARLQQQTGQGEKVLGTLQPLLDLPATDATLPPAEQVSEAVRDEARLLAASRHLEEDSPQNAATLLRAVGPSPTASTMLAQAEAMQSNWDAAEAAIVQADAAPQADRVATLDDIASLAYDAGTFEWAARWFARAADLDRSAAAEAPTERRIGLLSGLGFSLRELGRHEDAAATFAELAPLAEGNAPLASLVAYLRAVSLQQIGRVDEARRLYAEGSERFARDTAATTPDEIETGGNAYRLAKGAARLAADAEDFDRAAASYDIAATQLSHLPEDRRSDLDQLLYEWGLMLQNAERYDAATAVFTRLAAELPESRLADDAAMLKAENAHFGDESQQATARTQLETLLKSETAAEAVRKRAATLLLDRLTDEPDWAAVVSTADVALQAFDDWDEAAYARFSKANALLQLERFDEAVPIADAMVGELPDAAWADQPFADDVWVVLVESLVRLKKYDRADEVAVRFERQRPDSPAAARIDEAIGRSLKNRAQFEQARERLARVVTDPAAQRTRTAAKAQLLIAETYFNQERWDDALTEYFTLYANYAYPDYQAPALLQAAACDEQQGRFAEAVATYQTLLDEFPGTESAKKATERMAAARSRL